MVTLQQLGDLAVRMVQSETTLNDERAGAATTAAAATTALGGRVKTSRNRSGSRHPSPGQTDLFQRRRCQVERLKRSLQKLRSWPTRRGQRQFCTLEHQTQLHSRTAWTKQYLRHPRTCTSRQDHDKVATRGDGEGLKAWHSMVKRWDRKVRSRSLSAPEMRFDFARSPQ